MRKVLRRLHLILALTIGTMAALSGLTGSLLVFRPEIDRLLDRELLTVPPRGERQPLDGAIDAVRTGFPAAPVRFLRLPREPDETYEFWLAGTPARRVYVDPYDLRILGVRGEHAGLIGFVENLHEHLLAGTAGATVLGAGGLAMLLLLASGLALWWPRRGEFGKALRVRWGAATIKLHYDLHRLVGAVAFAFLFLAALTGSALVFHHVSATLLADALGGPRMPAMPDLAEPFAPPGLPATALLDRARRALPEAVPTWVRLPASDRSPFVVRLRFPENPHRNGTSYVALHSGTGAVLAVHSYRAASPGQRAADLRYPLHTGDAFGIAGRIAMAVAGLSPTILLVTGLVFWLARVRARRRGSRRDLPMARPTS